MNGLIIQIVFKLNIFNTILCPFRLYFDKKTQNNMTQTLPRARDFQISSKNIFSWHHPLKRVYTAETNDKALARSIRVGNWRMSKRDGYFTSWENFLSFQTEGNLFTRCKTYNLYQEEVLKRKSFLGYISRQRLSMSMYGERFKEFNKKSRKATGINYFSTWGCA